jgi:hypothetical protein
MPCSRDLMIRGAGISLDDWQIPWMTILVPFSTSWMKKDATPRTVEVKGTDMGLGVQKFRLAAGAKEWTWDQPYCAGTYEDRCATERTGKITYTTEGVGAEGKVTAALQVIDPTDKRGTVERTLLIDGTGPTVTLGGSATPTAYNLTAEAKGRDGGRIRNRFRTSAPHHLQAPGDSHARVHLPRRPPRTSDGLLPPRGRSPLNQWLALWSLVRIEPNTLGWCGHE